MSDVELISNSSQNEGNIPIDPLLDGSEVFSSMLNSILGNYFEYEHGDGNTLNLADVLLLIKKSIDDNTQAIIGLTGAVKGRELGK